MKELRKVCGKFNLGNNLINNSLKCNYNLISIVEVDIMKTVEKCSHG